MPPAESLSSQVAAWVEAIGAIAAVVGAAWVSARESRATRRREERLAADARLREQRGMRSTKTAALNLAILAATQIHDMHVRLRDEAWRGRVTRVSASRNLLVTENMLIAFPIQSLGDAPAMVAFSRFPGALATAAEVYANLERAVRAAPALERGPLFEGYTQQMKSLDDSVAQGLETLRSALGLPDEVLAIPA
jgi:hypothetical protein